MEDVGSYHYSVQLIKIRKDTIYNIRGPLKEYFTFKGIILKKNILSNVIKLFIVVTIS